eukprot:33361-Eustigmatos_ZCMA.PRE.1
MCVFTGKNRNWEGPKGGTEGGKGEGDSRGPRGPGAQVSGAVGCIAEICAGCDVSMAAPDAGAIPAPQYAAHLPHG